MNILIKLMSIVSLVIAPTLAQMNAKKAPAPLAPSAGGAPTGKVENIKTTEPIAKMDIRTTARYQ
jgi:hypothetical protein